MHAYNKNALKISIYLFISPSSSLYIFIRLLYLAWTFVVVKLLVSDTLGLLHVIDHVRTRLPLKDKVHLATLLHVFLDLVSVPCITKNEYTIKGYMYIVFSLNLFHCDALQKRMMVIGNSYPCKIQGVHIFFYHNCFRLNSCDLHTPT